jgi:hypothetical protein
VFIVQHTSSDDTELAARFTGNPLFAHLFATLSESTAGVTGSLRSRQSMSALEIVPSEHSTVTGMRLMELSFPAIKATDSERTLLVSKHTVGYRDIHCHTLMIDTITYLSTEHPRARQACSSKRKNGDQRS